MFSTTYGYARGIIDKDKITEWLGDRISLERGATTGILIFVASTGYVVNSLYGYVSSGFSVLPLLQHDILAFTLLVIGLQTVFFSFFLSMMSEEGEGAVPVYSTSSEKEVMKADSRRKEGKPAKA